MPLNEKAATTVENGPKLPALIKLSIRSGVDISVKHGLRNSDLLNARDSEGRTTLMLAAYYTNRRVFTGAQCQHTARG